MSRPRHLTFANVVSVAALVVATTGGGFAVAAGLAKNSVGSAQIKNNSVTNQDIKNNAVTGKDVKESTLKKVPKAASVDKVTFGKVVKVALGQSATVATRGPLTITLSCVNDGGGLVTADLRLTTSVNGAAFDANLSGEDSDVLNVGDIGDITSDSQAGQAIEQAGFSALTPSGQLWQGYGYAASKFGGSTGCQAQLVLVG